MISEIDYNLTLKYAKMFGYGDIDITKYGDYIFPSNTIITSNLYISNKSIFNSVTTYSNLYIKDFCYLNNVSINSSLNVNNNVQCKDLYINNNIYISNLTNINSNLFITGNTIINGNTTNMSQLNVNNSIFNTGIYTNTINSVNNSIININAPIINIGTTNTNIIINGTTTYIASTDILLKDKYLSLNSNNILLQDNSCGIQIMGISSNGFIKTNSDNTRYIIKSPLINSDIKYITLQDINNNLFISGTTNLINNTTILSSLYISNNSILNNNITINGILNVNNNTLIRSNCTITNNLNISNSTIINNMCTIISNLNVNNNIIINSNVSINSSLYNISNTVFNNNLSIQNINSNNIAIFNNNFSINSMLNINNSLNINNNVFFNDKLFIKNNINNNFLTITSDLNISNLSIFNILSTSSNLYISNFAILNNTNMNNKLQIFGQLLSKLPRYRNNTSAKNAGVPLWGWYRTGGVLKIRVNDIPPTINLYGTTSITIDLGADYLENGAIANDYLGKSVPIYLSINNSLISNILVTENSRNITQTSLLSPGLYTLTYKAIDSDKLYSYKYRNLNIIINLPTIQYSTSKANVIANTSTFNTTTVYYYITSNTVYTSTDFVKFTNNIGTIYYMDNNQIVNNNIVNTDNNGILWVTIGLITMQVYNPMNYTINYNSNTYSLYCNTNILLMSSGIYKNNNGSDYVYQYNNNWYYSIDMITFYQIIFNSTNTIVQNVSSTNIIYLYNNMVLTAQPLIHTLNSKNYWIFGIMRVNPTDLTDCCLYYNQTIYIQASQAQSFDGGISYIPTYIAPDWPINGRTSSGGMSDQFRNGDRFDNRVIIFMIGIGIGFITGTNKFSYFDTGVVPSSEPGRSSAYKINSDGTLDSVNLFYSFWSAATVYYSSNSGYMTFLGSRYGPGFNNHTVSDGNFKLKFGNAGSLTVTRISDNFSKSFTYLSINCKIIGDKYFQYVIWIGSSSNFDPHAIFDCSLFFNKGGYGYIAFESSSYFRPMEWNGGYFNPPCWNGDINQLVNGPISVSCKNLNSCGYINPKCLENYTLRGSIIAATGSNTILTQSIATQQNSNIKVINGQPTAVSLPISNYSTLGFPSLMYNNDTNWYAIAIPASRTPFFISNVNQFITGSRINGIVDFSHIGQFITNVLISRYWNQY